MAGEVWGARLLHLQGKDGPWAGGVLFPGRDGRPLRALRGLRFHGSAAR